MGDGGNRGGLSANSNKPEWLQQYDLIGKIGEGTYGLVFLARTKSPNNRGKSIAIKKFKQSKDGDGVSPTAIREIMVWFSLLSIQFHTLEMDSFLFCSILVPHTPTTLLFLTFYFDLNSVTAEISHDNVVKLVNVHINHSDMSLYLAFDYAEHELYVSLHSYSFRRGFIECLTD